MKSSEVVFIAAVLDELAMPVITQAQKNSRKGDEAIALLSRIIHAKALLFKADEERALPNH